MGAKLYVGNLSYSVTEERLQQHFAQHGSVVSARIITDKFSGRSKGFGFVEMSSDDEAQRAITAGRRSISRLKQRRARSYSRSPSTSTSPVIESRISSTVSGIESEDSIIEQK